jgi:pimeloyl-ACP methyl ester carboxylesterase
VTATRDTRAPAATRPLPDVEGVTHRDVETSRLRFHLAEAGPADAPPLLMLHGWPQHWYMWRHQIPVLSQHYRLLMPDMRGHGWSDAPPRGYDKRELADDFLALLDALELDRVRLMGHDWGGWAGFLMCLKAPERFERYVALNIPPPWGKLSLRNTIETWRFWYQWLQASPIGGWLVRDTGYIRGMFARAATRDGVWSDEDVETYASQFREPARAEASIQLYRTFNTREFMEVIRGRYYDNSRLATPTLLIFGTDDFAIPVTFVDGDHSEYADQMRVDLVPNVGHFIAEEAPELVSERALRFLSEPSQSSSPLAQPPGVR